MIALDLTSPDLRNDPYPAYARLRTDDPVHWSERHRSWFLLRYRDCETFFRDPSFSADRSRAAKGDGRRSTVRTIGSDPPEHTAVRSVANRGFTAREVDVLKPRIARMVDQLLDRIADAGTTFDLIADFAYPLPITVIAELFGVPEADRSQFSAWSRKMAEGMDHFYSKERGFSGADLARYLTELVGERRRRPREDDLISRMLEREGDDALSFEEVIGLCTVLVFAGHETTTNLIGNGILALLRNRDQFEVLQRSDAAGVRAAVEELLRYDSPAQMISRAVTDDIVLGDTKLSAGDSVVAVLGAANRDGDVFTEPERLDLTRHPNPHLAFGQGIHFCLGAALSRREAVIALPALVERFPSLSLAGDPVWRPTSVLRGLESLVVAR